VKKKLTFDERNRQAPEFDCPRRRRRRHRGRGYCLLLPPKLLLAAAATAAAAAAVLVLCELNTFFWPFQSTLRFKVKKCAQRSGFPDEKTDVLTLPKEVNDENSPKKKKKHDLTMSVFGAIRRKSEYIQYVSYAQRRRPQISLE